MSAFLIARSDCCDWDLPVFDSRRGDAIAVFTSAERAGRYLRERHLQQDHQVSEISAMELVEVIIGAQEAGVRYLAVNPQATTEPRTTHLLPVHPKLKEFAARLVRDSHRCGGFHQSAN